MRRAAVLVAAVIALAGCGTDSATSTEGSVTASESTSETTGDATSAPPSASPTKSRAEEDPSPSHEPAAVPAGTPGCATVWVDGTRLARDYAGCRLGQRFVEPDQEPCSFGQRLVRYGDHFYAVRGGPVNRTTARLAKDRDYRGAIASCRA
jgi:hypothetical protein